MRVILRKDLAANLASYGAPEASAQAMEMPETTYERSCQIGFTHGSTGMQLLLQHYGEQQS